MERTALTALPTLTSWLVVVYPSIYQSDHTNIKLYQHESKNILSENKMYHKKKKIIIHLRLKLKAIFSRQISIGLQ